MSIPELDKLLRRLQFLSDAESTHEVSFSFLAFCIKQLTNAIQPEVSFLAAQGLAPTVFREDLLIRRSNARRGSADLLHRSIREVKSKLQSRPTTSKSCEPQDQIFPGWWTWLVRLEREQGEQKVLAHFRL